MSTACLAESMSTTTALLEVAALGMAGYAGASSLLPIRGLHDWLVPGTIRRLKSANIAFTFDDGPDPDSTPRVLSVLGHAGVRATFFVVGERALRHPDLIRRIAGEGHAIGNHSHSHAWLLGAKSSRIRAEIERCQDAVFSITGRAPCLIRPPWGHRDVRFNRIAHHRGLTTVLWSLDSLDYLGLPARCVVAMTARATAGDIVLFHDGNRKAQAMPDALATLLEELSRRGQLNHLVTLDPMPTLAAASAGR